MIKRQIRYNFQSTCGEQTPHRWTFLIINEPREINRIKEKIYLQLQPIRELKRLDDGLIRNSGGLHYSFFSFSTNKSGIEKFDKIYNSKRFRKDRDLYEKDEVGLEAYLKPILEGRK